MAIEKNQTIRQKIIALLEESSMTVRDLSKALSVREKDIFDHFEHIHRSLKNQKKKLHIEPYQCQLCDFVFENRKKFTRPGRCPKCKGGSIEPAIYRIELK